MISNFLRRSVVPVYRTISLVTLYTVLFGIIGYGAMVACYLGTTTWVAPFSVTSSDTSVLAIMNQVTVSQNTLETTNLDIRATEENLQFSRNQLGQLLKLQRGFDQTLASQRDVWTESAKTLEGLKDETHANIMNLNTDVAHGEELRAMFKKDLAAGLITKGDAAIAIANIDDLASRTTDQKVAANSLLDNIRQHQMVDLNATSVLVQRTQVVYQVAQLASVIEVAEARLTSDRKLVDSITTALQTARMSPYYKAINSKDVIQLAVAPYGAEKKFAVGQPVYDCMFGLAVCFQVGKVAAVFPNEQVFENPLTKTNTRGYILELQVAERSVRSKSLVVNHRPLFF